jgi:hypothetical protein
VRLFFYREYLLRILLPKLWLRIQLFFIVKRLRYMKSKDNVINFDDIPAPKPPVTPTADEMKEKIKEQVKNEPLIQYPTIKPELNMYGIEELKDAVKAVCSLGNAIAASLADDGKITLGDATKFIGVVIQLPAAISGIGEVPKELADLTEQEKLEIITIVEDTLDVGDRAEEVTVRILNILYELKAFVDFIK